MNLILAGQIDDVIRFYLKDLLNGDILVEDLIDGIQNDVDGDITDAQAAIAIANYLVKNR